MSNVGPRRRRRHEQRPRGGVRRPTAPSTHGVEQELLPDSPADGLVEFDAHAMADGARAGDRGARRRTVRSPRSASRTSGARRSCGTARPASRSVPASAGRTCARSVACLALRAEGVRVGPEPVGDESAVAPRPAARSRPRARPLLRHRRHVGRVDAVERRACTSPTRTNAADHRAAGARATRQAWDRGDARRRSAFPKRCCRRSSTRAASSARRARCRGAPPIAALLGDQQASLVGQGCVRPGDAKITFGTGGMLDLVLGADAPAVRRTRPGGHVPDRGVARARRRHVGHRGDHARGRHQRAVVARRPRHHRELRRVARQSRRSATTPAAWCTCPRRSGSARPLGTTARAARCSGSRAAPAGREIVRAVLEGIAQRGADLVEAADRRHRHRDPRVARRRRHDRQPHVRASAGRRRAEAGRDLADARSDVARGRA